MEYNTSFPNAFSFVLEEINFFSIRFVIRRLYKRYSSPITGLEWPRVFQEVKVPRFHDNGTEWW